MIKIKEWTRTESLLAWPSITPPLLVQHGSPNEDHAEPSSWPSLTFLGLTLPPLLFVSLLFSSLLSSVLLLLSVNGSSSDVSVDQKMWTLWTPGTLSGMLGSAWKEKHFPLRLKCFWPSAASTLKVSMKPELFSNEHKTKEFCTV